MATQTISRRKFIKGAGALVVSFNFWTPAYELLAQNGPGIGPGGAAAAPNPEAASLDSWIAVGQDGTVTVFSSKVELGTGVETALIQIVAEELDVPFASVKMDVVDTSKTIDQGTTAGSNTIQRGGPQLRQAAAAARQELLKLASARLSVPAAQLTVNDGVVSAKGDATKKISYGELIGGRRFNVSITATGTGGNLRLAPDVPVKDPKDYKIVGTPAHRVDLPPKFTGEFTYAHDVRVPGMLHGRVVRPPVVNSAPATIDESSIKDIPEMIKVVREGNFLGVVATTEWSAIQAARNLQVTWTPPATKLPDGAKGLYDYLQNTPPPRGEQSVANKGNTSSALAQASKTLNAAYRWPVQLHGMLGPSCAVADVRDKQATIWTGSQGPFGTRKKIADLLGFDEKDVRVIYQEEAGCYGRLSNDDAPEDAAVMSRAVGKPVRVQWTRQDEHGWEPKGPAQLQVMNAGLDAQGKVIAWEFTDRSLPWSESGNPLLATRQTTGRKPTNEGFGNGAGSGGQNYNFENIKVTTASIPWLFPEPIPLRTSNLRAPGDLGRCFASESFMDELAAAAGADPVQFRLRHLSDPRIIDVLNAAVKKAGWQQRPSPAPASTGPKTLGRGVAVSNRSNTMAAAIAEVEVDRASGKIRVTKITLAHDCGLIVNPDGLTNQIEGNVIQAVSRTLLEEVLFDTASVTTLDWRSYPIITFKDVPAVDVVLINRPDMPALGGGEPSIVPVPAAIGNAVFDAIGVRMREAPLNSSRVLAALKA